MPTVSAEGIDKFVNMRNSGGIGRIPSWELLCHGGCWSDSNLLAGQEEAKENSEFLQIRLADRAIYITRSLTLASRKPIATYTYLAGTIL